MTAMSDPGFCATLWRCVVQGSIDEQTKQMAEHHRWLTNTVEEVAALRAAQAEHGEALQDVQFMLVKYALNPALPCPAPYACTRPPATSCPPPPARHSDQSTGFVTLTPEPRIMHRRFKELATTVRTQMDRLEERMGAKGEGGSPSQQGSGGHASDARISHLEEQVLGMKATMKDLLVRPPAGSHCLKP